MPLKASATRTWFWSVRDVDDGAPSGLPHLAETRRGAAVGRNVVRCWVVRHCSGKKENGSWCTRHLFMPFRTLRTSSTLPVWQTRGRRRPGRELHSAVQCKVKEAGAALADRCSRWRHLLRLSRRFPQGPWKGRTSCRVSGFSRPSPRRRRRLRNGYSCAARMGISGSGCIAVAPTGCRFWRRWGRCAC